MPPPAAPCSTTKETPSARGGHDQRAAAPRALRVVGAVAPHRSQDSRRFRRRCPLPAAIGLARARDGRVRRTLPAPPEWHTSIRRRHPRPRRLPLSQAYDLPIRLRFFAPSQTGAMHTRPSLCASAPVYMVIARQAHGPRPSTTPTSTERAAPALVPVKPSAVQGLNSSRRSTP